MDGLPTRKADPRSPDFDPNDIPPPPKETNIVVEKGEEMVQKEPLPKYESIEKLMQEIEHGTNKAMYEYKMNRMKEIAEMLEAKVSSLEEGEHAEYTDKKAINQMRKDIAALRKGEEKLRKEFDKKFNKKEKGAAPKKEAEAEKPTLQEGTFDLKKFLVENKMTYNSRLLKEEEAAQAPTPEEAAKIVANNADKLTNSPVIKAAAEKWFNKDGFYPNPKQGFISGAKWQQERSYSEEEVLELWNWLNDGFIIRKSLPTREELIGWFKQFKNK